MNTQVLIGDNGQWKVTPYKQGYKWDWTAPRSEYAGTPKNRTIYTKNFIPDCHVANSLIHRLDGPAIEGYDDKENEYWIDGVPVSIEQFNALVKKFKDYSDLQTTLDLTEI